MSETDSYTLKIIQKIFSNWTALRMSVEHGMGTKQEAYNFCTYVDQLLSMNEQLCVSDIAAELEDYFDSEFNTKLEDNSEVQVAEEIHRFHTYLKLKDLQKLEEEMNKLPPIQPWILPNNNLRVHNSMKIDDNESSDSSDDITPMNTDGWTVISRKKK